MAFAQRKPDVPDRTPVSFPSPRSGRWLEVVSHLDPKYGGLSAAVPELGRALHESRRISVDLAAFCAPAEDFRPHGYSERNLSFWPMSRGSWLHNPKLAARLHDTIHRADGIHIHGLWEQSTKVAAKVARALGKPYVVSAHGMLDPWALRHKRLKKLVYAALVERKTVRQATCLHALTHAEAADYRRFGAQGPIAVIPNGVTIPSRRDPQLFLERFPGLAGKRILLYLGRLHGKKGIDLLVRAWAKLAADHPDTHLVLAGPDSEGTLAQLQSLVNDENLERQTLFTGMLEGEVKWSALAAAHCFILPSRSEGLSVGVLEAMGMGLPVIITTGCNMPQVREYEAGWIAEPTVSHLTGALRHYLANSALANDEIGCRGSHLVEKQYNWASVASRMADVYRWVQGGPLPTQVEMVLP